MSLVQELTPATNTWLFNHVKVNTVPDRSIQTFQTRFMTKTVLPTLQQKPNTFQYFTDKDIDEFMSLCTKINKILQQKHTMQDIAKSDLKTYDYAIEKINKTEWLSADTKTMAKTIVEILKDYAETITSIILHRKDTLETELDKLEKAQLGNFHKSLYGSLFAFLCLMSVTVSESVQHTNTNVLVGIINQGYQLAQNLDSYSDTLDIMTNPKELELLEKAELETTR